MEERPSPTFAEQVDFLENDLIPVLEGVTAAIVAHGSGRDYRNTEDIEKFRDTDDPEKKMKSSQKKKVMLFIAVCAWLFAVGVGLRLIIDYENTEGSSGAPSAEWPAESEVRRTPGLPTLVTVVHPHCPCSRASIGELALLMVKGEGRVNANVMFVRPGGFPIDWERTDLWASAAMIPGVTVMVDNGGIEAQRFGSATSGQTMLYGADGQLLFSGGITSSRAHSGDNDGRDAIVALLTEGSAGQSETPVFGCPLFTEGESNKGIRDSCNVVHNNN